MGCRLRLLRRGVHRFSLHQTCVYRTRKSRLTRLCNRFRATWSYDLVAFFFCDYRNVLSVFYVDFISHSCNSSIRLFQLSRMKSVSRYRISTPMEEAPEREFLLFSRKVSRSCLYYGTEGAAAHRDAGVLSTLGTGCFVRLYIWRSHVIP